MVQLMNSGQKAGVKLEFDESLVDQLGPLQKRSKLGDSLAPQQFGLDEMALSVSPMEYNPLDEPSPLGLRLKKSPSFLDLIQMRLSQENSSQSAKKAAHKGSATSGVTEKLKASNFPASSLKIGSWEYKSRYEGDLVAKCYFAKHKLVWEVLDGGLKNKIEIQWSDIMALKAKFSDDGPDTLRVVLARQPLFFRETNPQPRKHTLWQATSDFTGGQASVNRCHFLESPRGLLGKHFEKLIQCDPRLNYLSQQPDIILESPFFEMKVPVFDDPKECRLVCGLPDVVASPSGAQTSSSGNEHDFIGRVPGNFAKETPPSCSVMDAHSLEEISSSGTRRLNNQANWDQIKFPGIRPCMSMSDLVNHIGHFISEQITSSKPVLSRYQGKDILEEITQYLLSDSQLLSAADEQTLMTRVNSLCCLLQKDPETIQSLQAKNGGGLQGASDGESKVDSTPSSEMGRHFPSPEHESGPSCKQAPSMSRKDSVGELLLNLPRIASLPQFLFNGSEETGNQAR